MLRPTFPSGVAVSFETTMSLSVLISFWGITIQGPFSFKASIKVISSVTLDGEVIVSGLSVPVESAGFWEVAGGFSVVVSLPHPIKNVDPIRTAANIFPYFIVHSSLCRIQI